MAEPSPVAKIFGWSATIICIYFFLAPVVPFLQVLKGKLNYKDSPGVLLIMSFMNCILWADYGLVKNDFQVYFCNAIGGSTTLIWITIYLIYLGNQNVGLGLLYNVGLILVLVGIMLVFYFVVPLEITGYSAMIFNVLMYAAPGEKIYQVINTKNYRLIPIFSVIGGFAASFCWLIYGLFQKDLNIIIPNGLGLVAAILQVIVYLIYYFKSKETAPDIPGESDEVV